MGNRKYDAPGLAGFYAVARNHLEDFYPSEQWAFERLGLNSTVSVLDLGAACGGLGMTLHSNFGVVDYVGIEIHAVAAQLAGERVRSWGGCCIEGDLLDATSLLADRGLPTAFDVVFSLSCVDWNTEVRRNVLAAWNLVRPGGSLVVSLRLHPTLCLVDMSTSWQPTSPDQAPLSESERAPYTLISISAAREFLRALKAERVIVNGYWGVPSPSAQTPATEVMFAVAIVVKSHHGGSSASQNPIVDVFGSDNFRRALAH